MAGLPHRIPPSTLPAPCSASPHTGGQLHRRVQPWCIGFGPGDYALIESIPQALDETELVCSSVNVGSTKAGINMDAVEKMGRILQETAQRTADRECIGAAKLVVFCNAPEDNPLWPVALHGPGRAGPASSTWAFRPRAWCGPPSKAGAGGKSLTEIAELIKRTAFKNHPHGPVGGPRGQPRRCVPLRHWICP